MLEEARDLGFLGRGPIGAHLDHADGFADVVGGVLTAVGASRGSPDGPFRAADLGSGGGIPGLPLALGFPGVNWTLVESAVRRAAFLRVAIERLGIGGHSQVVEDRAERVGRTPGFRSGFDLVVARSFGAPALVAECGAPLLRVGGRAVVSEPPSGVPFRWPVGGLRLLGLAPEPAASARGRAYQVLAQESSCPDRYPRRVGVPGKRPLF